MKLVVGLLAAAAVFGAGAATGWVIAIATRDYDPGDGPDTTGRYHDASRNLP